VNRKTTQRAIEESFPIVEINRLAVPERNAFKPIYQMHKWFARRAVWQYRGMLRSFSIKKEVYWLTCYSDKSLTGIHGFLTVLWLAGT
jgi:hypothetical protein